MDKAAFYDTKPYDRIWFERLQGKYGVELSFLEYKLSPETAILARGSGAVCAFVNDDLGAAAIDALKEAGVGAAALRCAGFNNVDLERAEGRIKVFRVPSYSPEAVAEHAAALLLTLNRKTHRAYNRTREFNFSLKGLEGFNLKGKTAGIVGMGQVGRALKDICLGFGMRVIAYDARPVSGSGVEYVGFEELCRRSDVISLHCPLTRSTYHLLSRHFFRVMKKGVYIINTSRGALIDSASLLDAIKDGTVGGAGLDVYEEETDIFYEDISGSIVQDDVLQLLISQPNVIVTSHQAFLTKEALESIAETTLSNLRCYFDGRECENEIRA